MAERSHTLDLLLQLMRDLRRNYDAAAAELGLTMSRARVITALHGREGLTQAELAQDLQIEAPTLKRQIDSLVALGFIERRGLDGDARKRALFLTGKARAAGISRLVRAVRAELFEGITAQDLEALDRALMRMGANAAGIGEKWSK